MWLIDYFNVKALGLWVSASFESFQGVPRVQTE